MGRPSKLHNAPKDVQDKVIALNNKGFSRNYIAKELTETGFKVDARSITRFLDSLEIETEPVRQWSKTNHVDFEETKTAKDSHLEVVIVDIEAIKKEYGLSEDLTKPENVIENVQKLACEILLLEQMICIEKLKAYAKGKCKHPNEAIRGCKLAYEIFASAYGIEQTININTAMETIQRHYGNLEALKQIEEV